MKALIIDDLHLSFIDCLDKEGIICNYLPNISIEDFQELIPNYEVLVLRSKFKISETIINKAKKLKIIGRVGAGLDNIDVEYANSKKIKVFGANEGNMDAVGDHTVGLILSLLNNIVKSNIQIHNYKWDREGNRGEELSNKIIGIIGYGNMGLAVAKRLKPFGCKILAYDKYKKSFSDGYVEEVTLEEIFNKTDILSLHIPLTAETNNLVNSNFINKFKKNIWLINTSRGNIVSVRDLVQMINEKKIIGAALDVLENENINSLTEIQKTNFNFLLKFDNVILTPHIAGWSYQSYKKLSDVLAEKIISSLK